MLVNDIIIAQFNYEYNKLQEIFYNFGLNLVFLYKIASKFYIYYHNRCKNKEIL